MARSSYIYIVFNSHEDILGAFTVKHEMESYVKRYQGPVYCRRYRDAHPEAGSSEQSLEAA